MSGPHSPDSDDRNSDDLTARGDADEPAGELEPAPEPPSEPFSQAYSAPESEQLVAGPYLPATDSHLYDYDSFVRPAAGGDDELPPPRWPWVVGVTAIVAAIALVVSVSLLVNSADTETDDLATEGPTSSAPPVHDEYPKTTPPPPPPPPPPPTSEEPPPPPPPETEEPEPPPPPPPPPPPEPEEPPEETATPSETTTPPETTTETTTTTKPPGPRQVTYSVTGTKSPGDIITVTYIDASGRRRTQRNVYIPWSITVTPISASEVGSVEASSLFRVSRLNCSITANDGTVLSSNTNNAPQTSC